MEAVGNASEIGAGVRLDNPLRMTYRPHSSRRPRILLAEDDGELRSLLANALRKDGYEIFEARDGAEVLGQLKGVVGPDRSWKGSAPPPEPPDVIVSDIRMPGLTGLEVLSVVRGSQIGTPVILITAFGAPETHAEAARLGAVAVFDKPFELDDLRRLLREIAPVANGRRSGDPR